MTIPSEPQGHPYRAQEWQKNSTDQWSQERQHLAPASASPGFAAQTIEAVKRANPLLVVLARYGIAVQGTGVHRMARCPFHDDAHPSLGVFLDTDRFFCFSCGASGDVIALVQQKEGIGFREAVQRLTQSASIFIAPCQSDHATESRVFGGARDHAACKEVTHLNSTSTAAPCTEPTLHPSIDHILLTVAASIYQATLRHAPLAQAYLRSRNIPPRVAQEVRLGYADGASLLQYLGHDDDLLRAGHRIGLLDQQGQERLRGRLIIPEFRMGQCIWMHGRLVPPKDTRTGADETRVATVQLRTLPPKYLGCALPKPLYGIGLCEQDLAHAQGARQRKGTMHRHNGVFVVEGAFDALAIRTLRVPMHCVALIGTHAGPVQRRELLQLANGGPIRLALDADAAGDAGAERIATWLHDFPGAIYRVRPPCAAKDFAELFEVAGWREARRIISDGLRHCEQLKSAAFTANPDLALQTHEHGAEPSKGEYPALGAKGAGQ